jgi:hypothetical protein
MPSRRGDVGASELARPGLPVRQLLDDEARGLGRLLLAPAAAQVRGPTTARRGSGPSGSRFPSHVAATQSPGLGLTRRELAAELGVSLGTAHRRASSSCRVSLGRGGMIWLSKLGG